MNLKRPSVAVFLLLQMSYSIIINALIPKASRFVIKSRRPATRCFASQDHLAEKTLEPGLHEAEMEVKKSRFIAYAQHVTSWEQAQSVIGEIRQLHPKARHWCVGFRSGSNPVNERSNDDGEPSGTAGAPILGAIRGLGLSDTLCVVVRYFGGIKLGAGGLIRAYGGAARLVLQEAPVKILIPTSTFQVVVESVHVGSIYEIASRYKGTTDDEEYREDGCLSLSMTVETEVVEKVRQDLVDATRGNAEFND